MATTMSCLNNDHSYRELYSFPRKRGKEFIVFEFCEICGCPRIVAFSRGGLKKKIVKQAIPMVFKRIKEDAAARKGEEDRIEDVDVRALLLKECDTSIKS